jgi:hypothetical protein
VPECAVLDPPPLEELHDTENPSQKSLFKEEGRERDKSVNASGHPADGEGVLIAGDDDGGSVWLQRDDDVAKLSCPSSLEPLHK